MTDDILFDPATGLPQLDENHAFRVERCMFLKNNLNEIEIHGDYDTRVYQVRLVTLKPQEFTPREAVYEKNWIFQRFSHWIEPKPLPREESEEWYEPTFVSALVDVFTQENLPENMVPESVKKLESYHKMRERNGWQDNAFIFETLELNDANIKAAAIRAYKQWQTHKATKLEEAIKLEKLKAVEDKYTGLYPPKGINTDE